MRETVKSGSRFIETYFSKYRNTCVKIGTFAYSLVYAVAVPAAIGGISYDHNNKHPLGTNATKSTTFGENKYLEIYFSIFNLISFCAIISKLVYLYLNWGNTDYNIILNEEEKDELHYSVNGEAANLFIRGGIFCFGMITVILSSIHLAIINMQRPNHCNCCVSFSWHLLHIMDIIFCLLQVFYLMISHRVVFIRIPNILKASNIWIMVNNISIFTLNITVRMGISVNIFEIYYKHISKYNQGNFEDVMECHEDWSYVTDFLLSCRSQFNLISAYLYVEFFNRCGRTEFIEPYNAVKQSFFNSFKRAENGMIFSFFVVGCTLLAVIFHFVITLEKHAVFLMQLQLTIRYILTILAIISCFMLHRNLLVMKFSISYVVNPISTSFTYIFYFCTSIFIMADLFTHLPTLNNIVNIPIAVEAVIKILMLIHVSFQTYIQRTAVYLCNRNVEQVYLKPGRQYIAALVSLNFCIWLITFTQDGSANNYIYQNIKTIDYHKDKQKLIMAVMMHNLTHPLVPLYYFISVVNFVDLFTKIYHVETNRIQNVWMKFNQKERQQSISIFSMAYHKSRKSVESVESGRSKKQIEKLSVSDLEETVQDMSSQRRNRQSRLFFRQLSTEDTSTEHDT